MEIVGRVASFLQSTFTAVSEEVGRKVGVIQRVRKFCAATLAQTVVLTFWKTPEPRWSDIASLAGTLGIQITANGIKERFQPALVTFLEELLRRTVARSMSAKRLPAELLRRFRGVYVGDSTVVALPDEMADVFPGCGGSEGTGKAALKIQTRMNLTTGEIDYLQFEAGRDCDVKSAMQRALTPPGSLEIYDLGYFDIGVLKKRTSRGVFWISRIQSGTRVETNEPEPRALRDVLRSHRGSEPLDLSVIVGASDRMPCRLLAIRCPEEVANRRRQALHEEHRRKGRSPSAERLEWCDWTILITSVPADRLTWKEVVVLYRSRWQIELLFKLWKSYGKIGRRDGRTAVQQMAFFSARLIAVILQHVVLLSTTSDNIRRSLVKAARLVKDPLYNLAAALKRGRPLIEVLEDMILPLRNALIDKRVGKPSWFQLLANPELLEWDN